jgi:hypothetical protein
MRCAKEPEHQAEEHAGKKSEEGVGEKLTCM